MVIKIILNHNGSAFYSIGKDNKISYFVEDGEIYAEIDCSEYLDHLFSITQSYSNLNYLLTSNNDENGSKLIFWDISQKKHVKLFQEIENVNNIQILFLPNNSLIICYENSIDILNESGETIFHNEKAHFGNINNIYLCYEKKTFFTCSSRDCLVKEWDFNLKQISNEFSHSTSVNSIIYFDNILFSGCDNSFYVWDYNNPHEPRQKIENKSYVILPVCRNPINNDIFIGTNNGKIIVYTLSKKRGQIPKIEKKESSSQNQKEIKQKIIIFGNNDPEILNKELFQKLNIGFISNQDEGYESFFKKILLMNGEKE